MSVCVSGGRGGGGGADPKDLPKGNIGSIQY